MKFKKIFQVFKKSVPQTTKKVTKSGKRADSSKKEDFQANADVLLGFFRADPVINAATWVTVDNVVPGYDIEVLNDTPQAEREKEEAEEALFEDDFLDKTRNVCANLVVFADSFQEVHPFIQMAKTKVASYMLDTQSIKLNLKENGEIKSYDQYINGKKVASLDPEEMIHYKVNTFGDRDKGLSVVESVLYSATIRKFIEKYNASIFMNHKPRGMWTFDDTISEDKYNDNVDLIIESKNDPNKDIFLRGQKDSISFKAFTEQTETAFQAAMQQARSEIVTGMMVPPMLLGIPEGSNRAGGDIQMQTFDRRVASIQEKINYTITTELLNKRMGFKNIRFVLRKSNKRDEIRELEIIQKMTGLVTLNEARLQAGLPELDEKDYPEANEIFNPSTGNQSFSPNPIEGQRDAEKFKKSLEVKKKVELKPVKSVQEAKALSPFLSWIKEMRSNIRKEINAFTDFKKQADPKTITEKVFQAIGVTSLSEKFIGAIKSQYFNSGDDLGKTLGVNFVPNQEELKFLEDYNFDLVKGLTDRTQENLSQTLRRGLLDGKTPNQVTDDVMKVLDKTQIEAERIVRTELNRANSQGGLNAMRETGLETKKYILIIEDKRTSDISKAFSRKYGTPEQAIPLDDEFSVHVKGKLFKGKAPPFHVNDRDSLVFTLA